MEGCPKWYKEYEEHNTVTFQQMNLREKRLLKSVPEKLLAYMTCKSFMKTHLHWHDVINFYVYRHQSSHHSNQ